MDNDKAERAREARLRRLARREGFALRKMRGRQSLDNYGEFRIIDYSNCVVAGVRFDMSLDDVEAWLKPDPTDP